MKKYCLIFILLLSACVSTTSEYNTDLQGNKVYKTSCYGFCSFSHLIKKTKEICPNQLKSAKGFNAQHQFAEVLFVCKDDAEVK